MKTCPACDAEIDGDAIEKGVCSKCGQEITYGSEGCGG